LTLPPRLAQGEIVPLVEIFVVEDIISHHRIISLALFAVWACGRHATAIDQVHHIWCTETTGGKMQYSSKLSQCARDELVYRLVHPQVFQIVGIGNTLPQPKSIETSDLLICKYRGSNGHILFSFDGIRVVIEAFAGKRQILRCAIRDRQLDGTAATSPLTAFPNSDLACNRLPAPDFQCCELSIYCWNPDSYLPNIRRPNQLGHFIANPDSYIWSNNFNPQLFLKLWSEAFASKMAPWQRAKPLPGGAHYFVRNSAYLLRELGYHRVDAVPSWFNVARFFENAGYEFTYGEHAAAYQTITSELLNRFPRLATSQHSWLVALQNIPELYIPNQLRLKVRWPVSHTNMYWVRMHRELNSFSSQQNSFTKRLESLVLDAA